MFKIYLLTQDSNNDYDTFDSIVVIAESEEQARSVRPGTRQDEWVEPHLVTVHEIGVANNNQGCGIVCASFRAG